MRKIENSKIPRLFEMMNEKGVKGVDITRDLHISSGNISDWKNGKSAPSRGTLTSLANYLGTTPEYLLGETDIKTPSQLPQGVYHGGTDIKEKPSEQTEGKEPVAKLIEQINGLTDEQIKNVFDYILFIKRKE